MMQNPVVRTMLVAWLLAGAAAPAAALSTTPASTPHLPLSAAAPAAAPGASLTDTPASFAAGAGLDTIGTDVRSAPADGMAGLSLPEGTAWPALLPEAGTGPALLIGLLAIAAALLRMAQNRR